MKKYNYKNCQSLFGYAAEVHIRCKGQCQLCGCGDSSDFDLWRQMTVEHLIGKSQGGYLQQIKSSLIDKFPNFTLAEINDIAVKIDRLNTVSACQFCNSTTSRDIGEISMTELIVESNNEIDNLLTTISAVCKETLEQKRKMVKWKLESVREAYDSQIKDKLV